MDGTEQLDERLCAFENKLLQALQPAICSLVQQTLETNQSKYAVPLQAQKEVLRALEAHQGRFEHTVDMLSHRPAYRSKVCASDDLPAPASHPEARDARELHCSAIEGVLRAFGNDVEASRACDGMTSPGSSQSCDGPTNKIQSHLRSCTTRLEHDADNLKDSLHSADYFFSRRARDYFLAQRKFSGRVLASGKFELLSGCVIAINVACMGAMTGIKMSLATDFEPDRDHGAMDMLLYVDFVFFAYYLLEILLKVHAFGPIKPFWAQSERAWNTFDFILVATAAIEIILDTMAIGTPGGFSNMSWLRLLKLLKMVKTLRIIRVMKFCKELRFIMNAIVGGMRAFGWALCILVIIMYMWALFLMQGLSGYLESLGSASDLPAEDLQAIQDDWGSVQESMVTLFKAVCGGGPWSPTLELIASTAGFPYDFLFLAYIAFMVLAVLKLLTGIFVNQAREVVNVDRSVVVAELQEQKTMLTHEFSDMFSNFDDDEDGRLTFEEFKEHLSNDTMRTYFASLDLDPTDPSRLWSLIDANKRGKLSQDEFISSLILLRRNVRWMHVQHLEELICDVYQLVQTVARENSKVHRATVAESERPQHGEDPPATVVSMSVTNSSPMSL